MQSIIDLIGATAIGGMLLITLFTSLITIQENNMTLRSEMEMVRQLEYVSGFINDYFLDKVGFQLPAGTEVFPKAKAKHLRVNTKLADGDDTIYLVRLYTAAKDDDYGYPFYIKHAGLPNIGPIWLAEKVNFKYYDVNEVELSNAELDTADGRARIRSVKTKLTLYYGEYNSESMVTRTIEFWKYFPNLEI